MLMETCSVSYLFDKHILLHFIPEVITMPHYGKKSQNLLLLQQKGSMHFHLQISELILCAASVSISQGVVHENPAMNTPMKNDAFEPALQCSKFESTLNNNQDQH